MAETVQKTLADLEKGDEIILVEHDRTTIHLAGLRSATEIRVRGWRFKLATGKQVGGDKTVHVPAPGECETIRQREQEEYERREREIEEEDRKRAEYEATPHYQLAERIANLRHTNWDFGDGWARTFTTEKLETIWGWIQSRKEQPHG